MNQTDLKHKLSAPFDFNEWKNICLLYTSDAADE